MRPTPRRPKPLSLVAILERTDPLLSFDIGLGQYMAGVGSVSNTSIEEQILILFLNILPAEQRGSDAVHDSRGIRGAGVPAWPGAYRPVKLA